jgi:purine-binding chemotaxis protein CheW
MQALMLPVIDDYYLVDCDLVGQVVAAPRPTAVPLAPAWVLGLINLRGEIVPLLDTAALLNLDDRGRAEFAVVVHTGLGSAALSATGMPEFVELDEDLGSSDVEAATTRFRVGERLAVGLDVEALLAIARGAPAYANVDPT